MIITNYFKLALCRCFLFTGLIIMLSSTASFALENYSANQFPVYSSDMDVWSSGATPRVFFEKLATADHIGSADLRLRAKASLKMGMRPSALNVLELKPGPASTVAMKQGGSNTTLTFTAEPSLLKNSIDLRDYDELWVDYRDSGINNYIGLRLALSIDTSDSAGKNILPLCAVSEQRPLLPLEEINVSQAVWIPKVSSYVLLRMLRRAPDEKWRYLPFGEYALIQRRLHRDLSGIDALDIVSAPEAEIENINVSIATSDNYSPGEVIELGHVPIVPGGDYGNQVYRINIPQILAERFPGKNKAYLQEVMVFLKGDTPTLVDNRSLKALVFRGGGLPHIQSAPRRDTRFNPVETLKEAELSSNTEKVSSNTKRMIVRLGALENWGRACFKKGSLSAFSRASLMQRGMIIEKIRLVKLRNKYSPVFLRAGENIVRAWGGPFKYVPDLNVSVEWPDIFAYIPFKTFAPNPSKPKYARNSLIVGGIALYSDKPFRAGSDTEALGIDGFGTKLELRLPVNSMLNADSIFILGATYGPAQVRNTVLRVTYENGSGLLVPVEPNKPIAIPGEGCVKQLILTFNTFKKPFHLRLKEAALFRPAILSAEEAFVKKIPAKFPNYSSLTSLKFTDGWARTSSVPEMRSAAEELQDWPVLLAGDSRVGFPVNKGIDTRALFAPGWFESAPDGVIKLSLARGIVSIVESPWFQLDSAVIVPGPTLSQGAWARLVGETKPLFGRMFFAGLAKMLLSFAFILVLLKSKTIISSMPNFWGSVMLREITQVVALPAKSLSIFWGMLALLFYIGGGGKLGSQDENYYFTFGGLAATLFARFAFETFRPVLIKALPAGAKNVLSARINPYFICAILALSATAVLAFFKVKFLSEQLAIIVYFSFVIGILLEARAVWNTK